ncbi:phosphate/phosphite/phosphonate ABC transporter substrate-binding protein [Marinobacter litoralis]|uniref:phosphate/phosphite/phosphonate ABC transporter substrate-binding protein n=1 Tax=Marinobacter litoralis TaxID=187981 RepID=UPI0018EBAFCA|nr:phosphate/phosphite/phosphonate ABC transporter substrate-binding protein [Marinobacter litoralis]MBJ6138929.1 phosphate/phosphite/phosphonate ABC transporter substrate-binding protein [Marinobacter litoralis]
MKLWRIKTRLPFFILLLACAQLGNAQTVDEQTLWFGIVPQQAAEKLAKQWLPVLKLLSEKTGLKLGFATAPSIPEFEKRLADGAYDFAYMNPHHFTVFNERPGYRSLARQRNHVIHGIIVVSADLNIESLEELAGKNLAFPAPGAFAATLITRAFLDSHAPGYSATFVNSHDSVYRAVAEGLFDAGGGIVRTYNKVDDSFRKKLEILWISPGYTGHAFAAHPRVSDDALQVLQEAMIGMEATVEGRNLLESLGMNGFQKASDMDWDDVRSLGIERVSLD